MMHREANAETLIRRRGEALIGIDHLRRWAKAELEPPELDAVATNIDAIELVLREKAGFE